MTQRDAFMEGLVARAETDKRIWLITDDFTCEMAGRFRHRNPDRFINAGPMEQTIVDVAVGLALSGRLPVVFGIAPFLIHRAQEQLRLAAMMGAGITLVGVGAGYSYDEAGPTHHGTDDYASARAVYGVRVWTCSDNAMARFLVSQVGETAGPQYFRLDRQELPNIHHVFTLKQEYEYFCSGAWVHGNGDKGTVVTHGKMVHEVLGLHLEGYSVLEVLRFPITDKVVVKVMSRPWVVVDEGGPNGGLAAAVLEVLHNTNMRCGLWFSQYYDFITGGRDCILYDAELMGKELEEWIVQRCV